MLFGKVQVLHECGVRYRKHFSRYSKSEKLPIRLGSNNMVCLFIVKNGKCVNCWLLETLERVCWCSEEGDKRQRIKTGPQDS